MNEGKQLPDSIRVSVGGRYWLMEFVDSLPRMYGVTDCPDSKNKKIRIRRKLREHVLLDTIIHELLHAAEWDLAEAWVEKLATHTSQVLTLAGWRRTGAGDSKQRAQLQELIRTCLRISKPHLDEDDWAKDTAKDITRVIWRLGWRCIT